MLKKLNQFDSFKLSFYSHDDGETIIKLDEIQAVNM